MPRHFLPGFSIKESEGLSACFSRLKVILLINIKYIDGGWWEQVSHCWSGRDTVEKPDKHYLGQVTRVNINRDKSC